jgi:serine/threonine-protein kinase
MMDAAPGHRHEAGDAALLSVIPGYRIGRPIGTGAGSRILLATRLKDGFICAVKHVVRKGAADDRLIQQVEREYEVSGSLEHAHLRRSYEIHRVRRILQLRDVYLVMEYIDGLPLHQARPNRLDTFLRIMLCVADGLQAMHEAGYIHCDVKPNNVMLGRGGVVKVIDFGQSCRIGERKERIQGTPDYIAPEQVRRTPLDRRTDVFNLGATMYWLLTSRSYPTVMRPETEVGRNILEPGETPSPHNVNSKIPLALSNLVMECCRDNPNDRPPDMGVVSSRIQAVREWWRRHREGSRRRVESRDAADSSASSPDVER